jgi:hypothetical protein
MKIENIIIQNYEYNPSTFEELSVPFTHKLVFCYDNKHRLVRLYEYDNENYFQNDASSKLRHTLTTFEYDNMNSLKLKKKKTDYNVGENRASESIKTYRYDERGYLKRLESQYNKFFNKNFSDAVIDSQYNRYEYENEYDINSGIINKSRCNHYLYDYDKEPTHISDLEFEYFEKVIW